MEAFLIRISWEVRRLIRQLGPTGSIGIALLLGSVVVAAGGWRPLRLESAKLTAERAQLESMPVPNGEALRAASADPATQLAIFDRFLAPSDAIPKVLESIHTAANQNGVALATGEFKLIVEPASRVGQYQMVFPIKAEYHQVRGFLRQVLKRNPQIALLEIGLRRDSPLDPALESRVRLALFLAEKP